MKLLILSTMKPLIDEFIIEQTNSVLSWTKLRINPTIIIFGDDKGVPEFCEKHNLINKNVSRDAKNVPYIADIFYQGYQYMDENPHDYVMYINADILLMNDFCDTLESFNKQYPTVNSCLLTAIRNNIFKYDLIDFQDTDWDVKFKNKHPLNPHHPAGIDLFLHKKNNYLNKIPEFVISRYYFDSYLIDYAIKNFEMSINITDTVNVYHHYGLWYQDNKVVSRDESNLEPYSRKNNEKLYNMSQAKFILITMCKFSSYLENGEIKFKPSIL
jgi:hypothetical protein